MKLIIDIDKQTFDKLTEYGEPLSAGNGFHDSILKAVAKGKPYEKTSGKWISVDDGLPEALQTVLVTSKGGYVYTSCIAHGEWEYGGEVVAWQPLPKPYKK